MHRIVPGTGTHNANDISGIQHERPRPLHGWDRRVEQRRDCPDANLNAIEYPASFWPLGFIGDRCPGFSCDTWNTSVATGVATLDETIKNTDGPIVVFGYSQGGAVVSNELRNLLNDPESLAKISDVVMIGNILNPDGGLLEPPRILPLLEHPDPGPGCDARSADDHRLSGAHHQHRLPVRPGVLLPAVLGKRARVAERPGRIPDRPRQLPDA